MKKIAILITLCISAQGYTPIYVPQNGLRWWWPFTGDSNDLSTTHNDGEVYIAFLDIDRFGFANSSYSIDGFDSYIKMLYPGLAGNRPAQYHFVLKQKAQSLIVPFDYGDANGLGGSFQIIFNSPCPGTGINVSNDVVTRGDAKSRKRKI